jgi:hypothetical protein
MIWPECRQIHDLRARHTDADVANDQRAYVLVHLELYVEIGGHSSDRVIDQRRKQIDAEWGVDRGNGVSRAGRIHAAYLLGTLSAMPQLLHHLEAFTHTPE